MGASRARKKTRFVPRTIFGAAMAGTSVIPICSTACGGGATMGVSSLAFDSGDSAAESEGGPSDASAG
jgi:hypothetical protein